MDIVEILILVVILGLLAAIVMPEFKAAAEKARQNEELRMKEGGG